MTQAKSGDSVKVHYTGKLEDGSVFDSSRDREALEFTIGENQVIAGFEEAVEGMEPGDKETVTVAPEKGYGERVEALVADVEKDQFPADVEPEVGQRFQVSQENGQNVVVEIVEIGNDVIKLDANHPLAGKELTFEIELLEVV